MDTKLINTTNMIQLINMPNSRYSLDIPCHQTTPIATRSERNFRQGVSEVPQPNSVSFMKISPVIREELECTFTRRLEVCGHAAAMSERCVDMLWL